MRSTNFARWIKGLSPDFFIRPGGIMTREGFSCSQGCPAVAWCKTCKQRIERRTCAERFLAWANSQTPTEKEA